MGKKEGVVGRSQKGISIREREVFPKSEPHEEPGHDPCTQSDWIIAI